MPVPYLADVLVTYKGFCFGQRIMLTLWYEKQNQVIGTGSIVAELAALVALLDPEAEHPLTVGYRACLPLSYTLTEVRAQVIAPLRSAYVAKAVNFAGTNTSAATVANDSACVTLRTAFSGRDQVANKHIGPIPDSASAAGLLTAGYKSVLVSLGTEMINPIVTTTDVLNTYDPVVYHRRLPIGQATQVEDFRIGEQSRVQRRRTVGLGE